MILRSLLIVAAPRYVEGKEEAGMSYVMKHTATHCNTLHKSAPKSLPSSKLRARRRARSGYD